MTRALGILFVVATLAACAGSQTGLDAGIGLGALDTTSKEQKENDKWFDSFYGTTKKCDTTTTSCGE